MLCDVRVLRGMQAAKSIAKVLYKPRVQSRIPQLHAELYAQEKIAQHHNTPTSTENS